MRRYFLLGDDDWAGRIKTIADLLSSTSVEPDKLFGMTYDEMMQSSLAGEFSIDLCGETLGLTEVQAEWVVRFHPDPKLREEAAHTLAATACLVEFLHIAFPVQMDLDVITDKVNPWTDEERVAACARIARGIQWRPAPEGSPRAAALQAALVSRAKEQGKRFAEARATLLENAVFQAAQALGEFQFIRFSNSVSAQEWYKDERTGKKAKITPHLLRWKYQWWWLHKEACRIASDDLLNKTHVPSPAPSNVSALLDGNGVPRPLADLLDTAEENVLARLKSIGGTEAQCVAHLLSSQGTSYAEIGRYLGVEEATARSHARRMRAKIKRSA